MGRKKEIKIGVTEEQAERFAEYAKETHRSRSEFLVEAAEQMIRRYPIKKTPSMEEELKRINEEIRGLKNIVHVFGMD